MGFAYGTNYAVTAHVSRMRSGKSTSTVLRAKIFFHALALLAVVASIALFVWGMFDVQSAIEGLRTPAGRRADVLVAWLGTTG